MLLLLSLCLAACDNIEFAAENNDDGSSAAGKTSVRIEVNGIGRNCGTKSILSGDDIETRISDVTLAAYDGNGMLSSVKYYESGFSSMYMTLMSAMPYNIYATANMGDMTGTFPLMEDDVASVEYRVPSYDDVNARGIPMSGMTEVSEHESGTIVHMDRLFAKIAVRILHTGLANYDAGKVWVPNLCNKSLYVRQANNRLLPFSASGSRGEYVDDMMDMSDYHFDMNDRASYEGHLKPELGQLGPGPGYFQDTTFVFYVPENVQGVLLPENSDPFKKVYENIANLDGKPYGDLCTYIEFNAFNYGTLGYSGDVMYRCYLGADNISDFSIERNCRYDMTLDFSEGGFFMDSWKVTRGENWTDRRSLYFLEDSYTVVPGRTGKVMIHFSARGNRDGDSDLLPERWDYHLDEESMAAAGLTVSFDPDKLVKGKEYNDFCIEVKASEKAEVGASFPITISTKEGAIVDHSLISIAEDSELSVNWDACPEYVSQYGAFVVSGYDESELPLKFTVSDESIISCEKMGNDVFRVVMKDTGNASITVSNADGSKSVTAYLNAWAPKLVLDSQRVELNPDGETMTVPYEYLTLSGKPLDRIDESVFNSTLSPAVFGCKDYFSAEACQGGLDMHIKKLAVDGGEIVLGGTYYISVGAKGCMDVPLADLAVYVVNPFVFIWTYDLGQIHDYTLFCISDESYGLAAEFADEIKANAVMTYDIPVPIANPDYVDWELVPRWSGRFSNGNGVYTVCDNPEGGGITIRQNQVFGGTLHSAGPHDLVASVKNRHSGERVEKHCGTADVYVHTAVGAEAVFGKKDCGHTIAAYGKTFADVYNSVAGRKIYQDAASSKDIHYMDVTMKWMTPVKGVHVLNMAGSPNDSYDGLSFVKPSVYDGEEAHGQLFSVCGPGGDDRIIICGEPAGARAGVGRVLYRSLLTHTYDIELSDMNLNEYFFNYKGGMRENLFPPAYLVSDAGKVKDGMYFFAPSAFPDYVDADDRGYHVIHFLDSVYPDTGGWINFIER